MSLWKDYEIECTDYLNEKFGNYAEFIHQGEEDSTVPDILVKTKSGSLFYIEVKHSPAQCGQFVLLPNNDTNKFDYSKQNVTGLNDYSQIIMNYMNCLFDEYKNAGVRGKKIDIENGAEIFVKWIIQVYRNKGVRFFITNNYNIVPIGDFGTYFDVTASYRVKRSGSSKVPKKNMKSVIDYVVDSKFDIFEHNEKGKKLYVKSKQALNKVKFSLNGLEYMFSGVADEFEIRKLSNTNNANVIFSVKYKNKQGISENEFIDFLK